MKELNNHLIRKVSTVKKKCVVGSTKFPHLHKGFITSLKLCRKLCSLRCLKTTHNVVKCFIPYALYTLNVLFASDLIKLNRCFYVMLSALRIFWSNLLHSVIVEGMQVFFKKVCFDFILRTLAAFLELYILSVLGI